MKTRTRMMLSLAAASLAVAGCQLMQGGGTPAGGGPGVGTKSICTAAQCQVFVTVNDGPSACTVVDPGSLAVKLRQKVLITWHLSPRSDFTTDGITFKQGQGSVFSGNQRTQKGVYQVWDDYSTPNNAGHFNYRIKVTTDSGHACDIDPEVVNG